MWGLFFGDGGKKNNQEKCKESKFQEIISRAYDSALIGKDLDKQGKHKEALIQYEYSVCFFKIGSVLTANLERKHSILEIMRDIKVRVNELENFFSCRSLSEMENSNHEEKPPEKPQFSIKWHKSWSKMEEEEDGENGISGGILEISNEMRKALVVREKEEKIWALQLELEKREVVHERDKEELKSTMGEEYDKLMKDTVNELENRYLEEVTDVMERERKLEGENENYVKKLKKMEEEALNMKKRFGEQLSLNRELRERMEKQGEEMEKRLTRELVERYDGEFKEISESREREFTQKVKEVEEEFLKAKMRIEEAKEEDIERLMEENRRLKEMNHLQSKEISKLKIQLELPIDEKRTGILQEMEKKKRSTSTSSSDKPSLDEQGLTGIIRIVKTRNDQLKRQCEMLVEENLKLKAECTKNANDVKLLSFERKFMYPRFLDFLANKKPIGGHYLGQEFDQELDGVRSHVYKFSLEGLGEFALKVMIRLGLKDSHAMTSKETSDIGDEIKREVPMLAPHENILRIHYARKVYVIRKRGFTFPGLEGKNSLVLSNTAIIIAELFDKNLKQFIKESGGKLSQKNVMIILRGLIRGLYFLNVENKIVHFDLKPSNVFINVNEKGKVTKVVVADFGCHQNFKGLPDFQLFKYDSFHVLGAPYYRPREVLVNKQLIDIRKVDMFALGITICECCGVENPWKGIGDDYTSRRDDICVGIDECLQYSGDLKRIVKLLIKNNMKDRPSFEQLLDII